LLDKIGPAVIMAHSMGGPSCWLYAEARPKLVKGLVGVEPFGPPFSGELRWGVTAAPMRYSPSVNDPSELQTVEVAPAEPGRFPNRLQAEQERKLENLQHIPLAIVTGDASYDWPYDIGTAHFLRQARCTVDHIELQKLSITGNAHMLMLEKNN